MRYLVNGQEMKALDQYTMEEIGVPSMVLMERAARTVVDEIKLHKPEAHRVLILCGSGNNGADGLAMARMMSLEKYEVIVQIVGNPDHATPEWRQQELICSNMNLRIEYPRESYDWIEKEKFDVIVDALLGTGLTRMVGGAYADVIHAVNSAESYVVAVDIPSGIESETGAVLGTAIRADLTVSFEYQKLGTALFPGNEYAGELAVRSIGIMPMGLRSVNPCAFTMDPTDLTALPKRPRWSNKGTFGRVLIIAGNVNMAGASILAGEAAYRTGAGLVQIYTTEQNRIILQSSLPEAILSTWKTEYVDTEKLQELCGWATSIVIGPGLGTSDLSASLVNYVLQTAKCPIVVDADALNLMAARPEMRSFLHSNCILTPHLGEMSRLTGIPVNNIRMNLLKTAQNLANSCGCIVVQKDARTVVAVPGNSRMYVNTFGNSGMATGGSGDVLAGIIGGLLAVGMNPEEAASYGVLMHALAGDTAAEKRGERSMLARDLIQAL